MALPGHPDFWGKLERARRERGTPLGLSLAVRSDRMPAPMLRVDDPIFPFGKAILRAVGDRICACAFPLMAFLAEGAAGMVAMERLMRFAPDPLPLLLDARWRDPAAAERYARAAFEPWGADALTVAPEFPAEAAAAFAAYPGGAVFWWVEGPERWALAAGNARAARRKGLQAGLAVSPQAGANPAALGDLPWIAVDVQAPDHLDALAALPPPAVLFVGEPILYASSRMDFEEAARRAAEAWRERIARCFPTPGVAPPMPEPAR